jgi:hypothetical protein
VYQPGQRLKHNTNIVHPLGLSPWSTCQAPCFSPIALVSVPPSDSDETFICRLVLLGSSLLNTNVLLSIAWNSKSFKLLLEQCLFENLPGNGMENCNGFSNGIDSMCVLHSDSRCNNTPTFPLDQCQCQIIRTISTPSHSRARVIIWFQPLKLIERQTTQIITPAWVANPILHSLSSRALISGLSS